jgi:Domain of unknown function (DUF6968)
LAFNLTTAGGTLTTKYATQRSAAKSEFPVGVPQSMTGRPMSKYPMTEIIAAREFECEGPQGRGMIVAQIGRPAQCPDGPPGASYCPYLIDGMGEHTQRATFGVDALQALLFAISAVRLELSFIAKATTLRRLDSEDLGISLSGDDSSID